MGEDGEMRRPWCPATRVLEHREMKQLNADAEEQRRASQARFFGDHGPSKPYRHDFPPLQACTTSLLKLPKLEYPRLLILYYFLSILQLVCLVHALCLIVESFFRTLAFMHCLVRMHSLLVKFRSQHFTSHQEGAPLLQKNEGQWEFTLEESRDGLSIHLDVEVGRFLDSSLIKADVQPRHVRLLIKVEIIKLQMRDCKCP